MKTYLTEKEKAELEALHQQERDKYICDRIKSVLLRSEGWRNERIAQALRIHPSTVIRHFVEYEKEKKLKNSHKGSEEKLDKQKTEELLNHLEKKCYSKVIEICGYVVKTYGVHYTVAGMTNWLNRHGFVYKQTKEIPSKADPEKQKAFIEAYEKLKLEVREKEPIYFMDSLHPTMKTKISSGWIRKGKEQCVKTTASWTRMNITGALDLSRMDMVYQESEKVNGESTLKFFQQVRSSNLEAKQIHMILDNAGSHKDSEAVKYAQENGIVLHYLPAYSPNLNPIERLWKVMNEKVRNNVYFPTKKIFRESILNFFENTFHEMKESLRSRLTDNFHVLNANSC